MGSSQETVTHFLEQLDALDVRARAMFGEFAVYCDEKVVVLVCNDRLFLKPTDAFDSFAIELERCPPYPGAKDYLVLDERTVQDRAQLLRLVQATADALPKPKPKKAKKKRARRKGK